MFIKANFEAQLQPGVTIEMVQEALEPVASIFPFIDIDAIGGHSKPGYAVFADGDLKVEFEGLGGYNFQEEFEALCERIAKMSAYTFVAEYGDDSGPGPNGTSEEYVYGPSPLAVRRTELEIALIELEHKLKEAKKLLKADDVGDAGLIGASAFSAFNNHLTEFTAALLVQMRPDECMQNDLSLVIQETESNAQTHRPRG